MVYQSVLEICDVVRRRRVLCFSEKFFGESGKIDSGVSSLEFGGNGKTDGRVKPRLTVEF